MALIIVCLSYKMRKLLYKGVRALSGFSGGLTVLHLLVVLYSFLRHSFLLDVLKISQFDKVYYNLALMGTLVIALAGTCWKLNRNSTFQPLHQTARRSHIIWCVLLLLSLVVVAVLETLLNRLQDSVDAEVGPRFQHGTSRYLDGSEWQAAVDRIQSFLGCCGVEGHTDWYTTTWLPASALNTDPSLYSKVLQPNGKLLVPLVPSSCCRSQGGDCGHKGWLTSTNRSWSNIKPVDPSLVYTRGCKLAIVQTISSDVLISRVFYLIICMVEVVMLVCTRYLYSSTVNSMLLGQPKGTAPGWLLGPEVGFSNWQTMCLREYAQKCVEDEEFAVDIPDTLRKKGIKNCIAKMRRRCKRKEPDSDATGTTGTTLSRFSPCIDRLKQKIAERRRKKKNKRTLAEEAASQEETVELNSEIDDLSGDETAEDRDIKEEQSYRVQIDENVFRRANKNVQRQMSGNLLDIECDQKSVFNTHSGVNIYDVDTNQTSPFINQRMPENTQESQKPRKVMFIDQPSPRSEERGAEAQGRNLRRTSKSDGVRDFRQTRNMFENAAKVNRSSVTKTDPKSKKYRFPSLDLIDFNEPPQNKQDPVAPRRPSPHSEESYPVILRNYVIPED
uniref:Tetraspanin n=1 Tax=Graphocephala atropunctata TaxID=36148 RepID=A0A1B6L522_9HEMI